MEKKIELKQLTILIKKILNLTNNKSSMFIILHKIKMEIQTYS